MRFPIFPRKSNPAVDRPVVRKKMVYLEAQVAQLLADWVDSSDKSKGIICRDMLYFGPREFTYDPPSECYMPPREIPGVFFQEPQSATWRRDHRTVTFLNVEQV